MLYVFHVDVGRMMNFDMTVALSSVENLKDTIERLHGIPAANIVLLVSGGEMLTQSTQVSCYSAGTDTNPIYMFLTGDAKLPPITLQNEPDLDLREQVERSLELPAVYETVVTRAQLALRMHDLARDEERLCERLVHDQHLQQQGWSAVVANMEDLTDEFRRRYQDFCIFFDRHLEKRPNNLELLHNFGDDLTQLARIPILPGLMPLAEEDFHGFDEFLDTDEVFSRSNAQESVLFAGVTTETATTKPDSIDTEISNNSVNDGIDGDDKSSTSPNKKLKMCNELTEEQPQPQTTSTSSNTRRCSLNLLQWITSKENHNTLKLMSDECAQGLGTFDEVVYEKLKVEVQHITKIAEQGDVKEIKGLGDRLCRLEEFKYKIKGMVQDQKELSTAFKQNQTRANNLRDASILPDLCASHQSQLVVMLQNHQKIRELSRSIAKAKDELGTNLHTRLKRIVLIENSMSEFDNRLLFYHRCLRRAERHISIIEQIHQAPSIYVAAVTEVVRRKIFSGEFRLWASKLAEDFDIIHSEEIKRRQLFNDSFNGHFLNILFPGMCDMPPAFANENPLVFDARLPNITKADIDVLSSQLPDLASQTQLPDMEPVINFFVSRSGTHQKERLEELLRQQVAAALGTTIAGDKPAQNQRLGELQKERDAGCDESETDTETEFEQVPASMQTVATSTSENQIKDTIARSTATDLLLVRSAATLTDENNETEETAALHEIERLRSFLGTMSKLAVDCIRLARTNIDTFRSDAAKQREHLESELRTLNENWSVARMQFEAKEQQLQLANAEELQLVRNQLHISEKDLQALQQHHAKIEETLQTKCSNLEQEVAKLCAQLAAVHVENERAIMTMREDLIREQKTEIESLRCRFKLMTSMDRSPSDSSLEKIERPTSSSSGGEHQMIELCQHETILAQLRATLEADKISAINAAIDIERSLWQSKIFPMNSESVMANVGILKDMLEEKERQLDQLREKDLMLTKDNYQLLTRLDALTNEEGSWQKEKIEYLLRDKSRLEEELTVEKTRRLEMETSVAGLRSSTYEQAGGAAALPRSRSSSSNQKFVVLESCGKGDIVFVVWSVRHGQFMVVQDSQSLYFVHNDSLAALNLRLPTQIEGVTGAEELLPIPMPYYALGRVTEKEYCQAKKDENRYRVTRGSKFYRIKLAPLLTKQATRRERLEFFSTSLSRSDSHSEATPVAIAITTAKDVVDSAVATSPNLLNVTTSTQQLQGFKERTISISSVTEEDDEPLSLLSERCRYISVSEEEELAAAAAAATETITDDTPHRIASVITEQPTASSKLKMDLMLAAADLPRNEALLLATATTTLVAAAALPTTTKTNERAACTTTIPTSIGTGSEDSDEYRSLDGGKDEETDFPISE